MCRLVAQECTVLLVSRAVVCVCVCVEHWKLRIKNYELGIKTNPNGYRYQATTELILYRFDPRQAAN